MGLGRMLSKLPAAVKDAIKARVWPTMLAEGESVPEWHLQGHDGEWYRQGVHWTVMAFLPAVSCAPEVGAMLDDLELHHERLAGLGARVFVVMAAEEPELTKIANERHLSFPILTDRGASVSRMFRAALQLPLRPLTIPTLYLVNPDRRIRLANRGTPSVEAVLRSIEALQQATRKGM
jgi:peroxiredoxin